MTAREVIECVDRIMKRQREESLFQARLHGAKVRETQAPDAKPLNEKEAKHAEDSMARMVREKQEELARKKQGIRNGRQRNN